ncbi:MAG: hypothetical protein IPP79_21270 [Chitinophagaceae bacterium]|nr:hypothetical protein [Chitinophagaceae bacterium]
MSMHNFTIDGLYRMAYQLSNFRIVYDMDKKEFDYNKQENKYCLDVIVPKEKKPVFTRPCGMSYLIFLT